MQRKDGARVENIHVGVENTHSTTIPEALPGFLSQLSFAQKSGRVLVFIPVLQRVNREHRS